MDILIRKWNNFLNITPLGFIQIHGYSPLNNGSKSIFLHSDSSWFVYKLEELARCPNKLNMDILIRKRNNFFNITPMGFIQLQGDSTLLMVPNQASYIVINPGFVRSLKNLPYVQTG